MESLQVLVVEDEWVLARDLVGKLERLGYRVLPPVSSGAEALKAAQMLKPDVVLMDVELTDGKDAGLRVAEAILDLGAAPVLIFLTKFDDAPTLGRISGLAGAQYLAKGASVKQLQGSITLGHMRAAAQTELEDCFMVRDAVMVRGNKGAYQKVKPEKILWLGADGTYTTLHVQGMAPIKRTVPLQKTLGALAIPQLMRVHRSHAVNLNHVVGVDVKNDKFTVQGGEVLDLGEPYKAEFLKRFRLL